MKFTKAHKIAQNSEEILSNTCLCNIFETYLSKFILKLCHSKGENNIPKLPGIHVNYVAKKLALAMMLKALALVYFWSVLLLKEQMTTSV